MLILKGEIMSIQTGWLKAFVILVFLFAAAYSYDLYASKQIQFQVEADPLPAPADGSTVVTIKVNVSDSKGIRVGDNITIRTKHGSTDVKRAMTNAQGLATFHYFIYKNNIYQEAKNVIFEFRNESTSKFIQVDPTYRYELEVIKSIEGEKGGGKKVYDKIFN